ncbi:MAG: RpiB/LacA/LacB family sugar-phosphate isomerase [Saprospiraceae bacterium]|uniref:RpiB/LacA/LacB family sugar-phosphate isomerase n=1 Tax=Candidatus Opimibacter skivensis TaxID=2982028 RepID=A0A9D7SUS1_9BACT|nr:RpiB/LacA/LacB family sugar-phosphate isomerase [Candidatus Opimibacter skivensis]
MASDLLYKIGIAADHGGFVLKEKLKMKLHDQGYEVIDFGNTELNLADDYPDYILPLAKAIADGWVSRGIAICGSGVGACIIANKVAKVRACLIHEDFSAHQGVEDDNMNMICLGGRVIDEQLAWTLTTTFLAAKFSALERHVRRLRKVTEIEKNKN